MAGLLTALGGDDTQIVIESRFSPPITIDLPATGDGSGKGTSPVVTFARPKVTVLAGGATVATFAPYGEPGTDWRWVAGIVGVGVLLVVGLAIRGAMK